MVPPFCSGLWAIIAPRVSFRLLFLSTGDWHSCLYRFLWACGSCHFLLEFRFFFLPSPDSEMGQGLCGIFRFGHLSLRSTRHLSASFWWSLCSEGFLVLPRVIPKGFTLQTRYIELGSPSWVLLNPHLEVPSFLTFPGQYFHWVDCFRTCVVRSTLFPSFPEWYQKVSLSRLDTVELGSPSWVLLNVFWRCLPSWPFPVNPFCYGFLSLSLSSSLPRERHHVASRFSHAPSLFRAFLANFYSHSVNKLFSLFIYFV